MRRDEAPESRRALLLRARCKPLGNDAKRIDLRLHGLQGARPLHPLAERRRRGRRRTGADVRPRQPEVRSPRDQPRARRTIDLQRLLQMPARVVEAPQFDFGHAQREQAVLPRPVEPVRSRQREAALQDLAGLGVSARRVEHHADIVEQQRLLMDVAKRLMQLERLPL